MSFGKLLRGAAAGFGKAVEAGAAAADRLEAAVKADGLEGLKKTGAELAQEAGTAIQDGAGKLAKTTLEAGSQVLDKAGKAVKDAADNVDGPKPPKP